MNSTVEERVKKIIIQNLGISEMRVINQAKLMDDLGADSLEMIELFMDLEDEFRITFPDFDIKDPNFRAQTMTVDSVINLVKQHGGS